MAINSIDLVDVKQAIKKNQLYMYVKYNVVNNKYSVYLQDTTTKETVLLGEFSEEKIKEPWM